MPININGLYHIYQVDTPLAVVALRDVNLEIKDGEFLAIIGPTGSGKSTLVQHLNGLLRPTRGTVTVDGVDLTNRRASLREVRQKVGLIFQYPEHQMFEETLYDDLAFGPRNMGLDADEIDRRVREAARLAGLDEGVLARSPFELSGGQMRRAAIAGILAMKPRYLVLDEPTAGLDPRGRDDILGHIQNLHRSRDLTVVLVSHNMEDVARLASRVVVMDRGRVVADGPTRDVFKERELLERAGLAVPQVTELMSLLAARGCPVRRDVLTVEEARREILASLKVGTHA